MSLLPGLPASPFSAGTAQASLIPSSEVAGKHGQGALHRAVTRRDVHLVFACAAEINLLQFCEFGWDYRVGENKKETDLMRCFYLRKSVE